MPHKTGIFEMLSATSFSESPSVTDYLVALFTWVTSVALRVLVVSNEKEYGLHTPVLYILQRTQIFLVVRIA